MAKTKNAQEGKAEKTEAEERQRLGGDFLRGSTINVDTEHSAKENTGSRAGFHVTMTKADNDESPHGQLISTLAINNHRRATL